MGVPTRGLHLENSLLNGKYRDVKGAATKVKDEDVPLPPGDLLVEAVGDGGGGGLVDDAEDVQAGNNASILQRLKKLFFVIFNNNIVTFAYRLYRARGHEILLDCNLTKY
jgi:hypothetical protein